MSTHPSNIKQFPFILLGSIFLLAILMAGCQDEPSEQLPPPTIASIFNTATPFPTITPRPTLTPFPTLTPTATPQLETIIIYDDGFKSDWSIENSIEVFADPASKKYAYDGQQAIEIIPRVAFTTAQGDLTSRFYVTLNPGARQVIRKKNIDRITFYLNPGADLMVNEDIGVAMQGSNEYPYWVEGDESARVDSSLLFSETTLTFFEITNDIPPETWVKIEIFPNELIYDPPYEYFTGFYIKNDTNFLQPFYIDRIELTLIVDNDES